MKDEIVVFPSVDAVSIFVDSEGDLLIRQGDERESHAVLIPKVLVPAFMAALKSAIKGL